MNSVYVHGINWRVIAPWMVIFLVALIIVVGAATLLVLSQSSGHINTPVCVVQTQAPTPTPS